MFATRKHVFLCACIYFCCAVIEVVYIFTYDYITEACAGVGCDDFLGAILCCQVFVLRKLHNATLAELVRATSTLSRTNRTHTTLSRARKITHVAFGIKLQQASRGNKSTHTIFFTQAMKQLRELHPRISTKARLYKYYLSKLQMIGIQHPDDLLLQQAAAVPSPRHHHHHASPRHVHHHHHEHTGKDGE